MSCFCGKEQIEEIRVVLTRIPMVTFVRVSQGDKEKAQEYSFSHIPTFKETGRKQVIIVFLI
jgi:hypothetical protein